jgi:hypothetical protein
MMRNIEVRAVASIGPKLSGKQPDKGKLRPLSDPEGPEQLLLGVF